MILQAPRSFGTLIPGETRLSLCGIGEHDSSGEMGFGAHFDRRFGAPIGPRHDDHVRQQGTLICILWKNSRCDVLSRMRYF